MKNAVLILFLAASTAAATAQTAAKPATTAKPVAKPAATSAKAAEPTDKLPAGMTVIAGPRETLYTISLRYQDEKIGDGATAEPGKMLKYGFTLWTAGEKGVRLDSTDDHRMPALDKDKKPVMDADGKPVMGDPQPAMMIKGQGRPFPGWDQGFDGMKAGGKRRVFIPWQLGLGDREIPARDEKHPAIAAKSDLILDIELKEVSDAPAQPQRPSMGMHPQMGTNPAPGAPGAPAAAPTAPAPAAAPSAAPAPAVAPAAPVQPQSK